MVNMQILFISSSLAYSMFHLTSIELLALQATGLAIFIVFPEIVLWLPIKFTVNYSC